MIIGVKDNEQEIIENILKEYDSEYSFYYYGSRVKGTFEPTSDLDILIKGKEEMPIGTLEKIKEKFDNSRLPYIVNFSDYNSMDVDFYNKIKQSLVNVSGNKYRNCCK